MGVRFPSVGTTTFIGPLPASGVETIVLTTPPLTIPLDFATVILMWYLDLIAGTGTTSFSINVRRGTGLGVLVGVISAQQAVTAGNKAVVSACYFDTPGAVAGQQYSLTVQQVGATVAGTFQDGCLIAFAL